MSDNVSETPPSPEPNRTGENSKPEPPLAWKVFRVVMIVLGLLLLGGLIFFAGCIGIIALNRR
jgi:hypothetical protein